MTASVSSAEVPADLPLEITTFVGRRSDRRRIRELVSESRLVTLTGFGGIGKTRLALRMATDLRRAFAGVYVAALGGLSDPESVPDQVAAALGLQLRSRQSATIAVVEYLRPKRALLVLDNCEHVVEMAAIVADTLLRTCPNVHLLATSREPLRIAGEVEYPLSPLTVPPLDGKPLQQFESVQLLLDRARAIIPEFALTDDNRAAVSAISRKLEGIPLAIELAAARLRVFSPAELNAHLTDRWELLGGGGRTDPFRHRTMEACIEWSFDLCTPAEKLLWAKAAVFVDGFELDAAVSVCSDPQDSEPVEQVLASLVEKSVLLATRHPSSTRYRMLPPIRQRGRDELVQRGLDAALRRRHKDYYAGLVARAREEWFSARQLDWITCLRRERGNIGKMLELCAVDPDSADQGLAAGGNLLEFGLVEGRFEQGRRWFERVLADHAGDAMARTLALRTACVWAAMQGDLTSATSLLAEGQAIARGLDSETQLLLTQAAGLVALCAGDPTQAAQLLSEASRGFAESGNDAELALCSVLLALNCSLIGDIDGALEHHRACVAVTEPASETWLRSWSMWIASMAHWRRGDAVAAEDLLAQSLRLKRLMVEPLGIAVLLETRAWFSAATEPESAVSLLGAAQNEWDKIDTTTQALPVLGTPHSEATAATRARLDDATFDLAWSRGRALDHAAALAIALREQPALRSDRAGPRAVPSSPVLTRREHQIAGLIRQGLSNKEIADALVISRRTAETHVEHILTKLGFTNRTQVAAWIADQLESGDH